MMRIPRHAARALLALAALPALSACLPSRVVLDLNPGDGKLEATVVQTHPPGATPRDRVAIVEIEGLIAYAPPPGLFAGGGNAVDRIVGRLRHIEDDPSIKAVVLRVNSPGGTVASTEELFAELRAFRERSGKPVVAWFGEIATSGAYYAALAADAIVAQPSTITASIGVLVQTFNFSEGMRKIGIQGRAVTSGDSKALASPFEPPEEAHYQILQGIVDEFYADFRARVAERFPAAAGSAAFDTLTDGRVITGAAALDAGLVDETGTLRDAFRAARDLAGIESASLVTLRPEGATPASAYASASSGALAPSASLDLAAAALLSGAGRPQPNLAPGVYYLWLPPGAN
jgi:protease-4